MFTSSLRRLCRPSHINKRFMRSFSSLNTEEQKGLYAVGNSIGKQLAELKSLDATEVDSVLEGTIYKYQFESFFKSLILIFLILYCHTCLLNMLLSSHIFF